METAATGWKSGACGLQQSGGVRGHNANGRGKWWGKRAFSIGERTFRLQSFDIPPQRALIRSESLIYEAFAGVACQADGVERAVFAGLDTRVEAVDVARGLTGHQTFALRRQTIINPLENQGRSSRSSLD